MEFGHRRFWGIINVQEWILSHGLYVFTITVLALWKLYPWIAKAVRGYMGIQTQVNEGQDRLIRIRTAERDDALARCEELECKIEDLEKQLRLSEQKALWREDFDAQNRAKIRMLKRLCTNAGTDFVAAEKEIERAFAANQENGN